MAGYPSRMTFAAMDRIADILPPDALETVTVLSRLPSPPEFAFTTGESWPRTQRRALTADQAASAGVQLGQTGISFELHKRGQSVVPKVGDRVRDAATKTWSVLDVGIDHMGFVIDLSCVLEH